MVPGIDFAGQGERKPRSALCSRPGRDPHRLGRGRKPLGWPGHRSLR
jgi:hypothetical protein